MRIQHNIMAMNSYRNYSSNTSALSKNLEKLSSGYKINRAGDDAAGLAISEKMRAQISGLEQAQSNAKSGINLVQTAEGALTEVHSMLNRMVTLADQSANGTYDNETDRANLQKEVSQLKSEINRIADSSNFNGINLLDGSLSANGTSASVPEITGLDTTTTAATKFTTQTANFADGTSGVDKGILSMTVNYTDEKGTAQSVSVKLTIDSANKKLVAADGTTYDITANNDIKKGEAQKAFLGELNKSELAKTFKMSVATDAIQFDARTSGSATTVKSILADVKGDQTATPVEVLNAQQNTTAGVDAFESIDMVHTANKYTIGDVFTVGGQKFAFANTQEDAVKLGEDGVNAVVVTTKAQVAAGDVTKLADLIEQKTGYKPTVATTSLQFKAPTGSTGKGGLTLQIGDTAEKFNQLTVSVGDMHAKALGIGDVDISTQAGASSSIEKIKAAINSVSSTRGDLGATQNRLDHTINNLSVMTENIQDAESTVRDTDVAKEMMAYTKNNILVQSAQAMLAQANQVPQGVLQLLQ